MKEIKDVTIHVVHGLPASGKSTWVRKFVEQDKYKVRHRVLDVDALYKYFEKNTNKAISFEDYVRREFDMTIGCLRPEEDLIIDGLFLTNEEVIKMFSMAIEVYLGRASVEKFSLVVEDWNEARETCIRNDKLRNRTEKARLTIENAPWEYINISKVKNELETKFSLGLNIHRNSHSVYVPSVAEILVAEQGYHYSDRKIHSESWCGGGTYGSCYGGLSSVSADEPVAVFEELLDVTESLGINLTARQYFEIMTAIVTMESRTESDYYGGSVDYYSYVCDIDALYDWLVEKELLKEA